MKCERGGRLCTLFCGILIPIAICIFGSQAIAGDSGTAPAPARTRTFRYGMNGRVRLLLFWIGRDNVGRGTVTCQYIKHAGSQIQEEKWTVLFGTLPDRVPWRINRWGYGEEIGQWISGETSGSAVLKSSRFTGFIGHSPEESISQLSASHAEATKQSQHWYDGIVSTVNPDEAETQVYYFPMNEEVSIDRMEAANRAFASRIVSGLPDKSRKLSNNPLQYDSPQGFLICLRRMMSAAVENVKYSKMRKQESFKQVRSTYIYNARRYYLRLKKVNLLHSFILKLPEGTRLHPLVKGPFYNVAEADFEIENTQSGERHGFSCWIPTEGPLEGIPIQIYDKPRWWLQVRLQLADIEETVE